MEKFSIPFVNIVALSCDNAAVMVEKHIFFFKLEAKCKYVQTFACPCHAVALISHAACAKIPAFCDDFLKKLVDDMRYILKSLLYALSYDEKLDEDDLTKWLRQEAVKWTCIFGDRECQQIASDRLKKHLEDPTNHK
ncbi:hypothetical protein X777_12811 [Ooceraea biroi]|uniref:Uncharacterized protein n=1 Tax=Ooceraea biroi TaxID=2015173 RepID=A0A026VYX3_OOCBI|nr:hypothetical protein X777_12811 [Ooceraea biroi]